MHSPAAALLLRRARWRFERIEPKNMIDLAEAPKVATEMTLCVLTYNLTRELNIVGIKPMMAIKA